VQQLGDALKVMAPDEEFDWIRRAAWRLHARAESSKDLRKRLRAADEVFRLGLKLMKAAEEGDFRRTAEQACLYRDGLTIAFLIMRPIRSRNLTNMTIGREVARRGADWWLCLGPDTSKSGRPFECPWPSSLTANLDRYLEVYRPALLAASRRGAQPGKSLWISAQGTQMTSDALSTQVKTRTGEEFGEPINLHSFRHIAATTIATVDPANAAFIAAILDHTSFRASDKHYNRARTIDAARRYGAVLAEARTGRSGGGTPLARR
jgi:integrase